MAIVDLREKEHLRLATLFSGSSLFLICALHVLLEKRRRFEREEKEGRSKKRQSDRKFRKKKRRDNLEIARARESFRRHANRNGQVVQLNSAEPRRSLNYRREREGGEGGSSGGSGGSGGGTEGEDRVVSLASIY